MCCPALNNVSISSDQKQFNLRAFLGIALVITAVAMVVLAAVLASGVMNMHQFLPPFTYFLAAGLVVGALIPVVLASVLLTQGKNEISR